MDAMKMILLIMAGWMNRRQQHVIDYLQEEIRTLKEQLEQQSSGKRPRFTDVQRSRLARKAKRIRYQRLKEVASHRPCWRGIASSSRRNTIRAADDEEWAVRRRQKNCGVLW